MSQFSNEELREWLMNPVTQEVLAELKTFRNETFESILCTPRDERADVSFRVEGMDLVIDSMKKE